MIENCDNVGEYECVEKILRKGSDDHKNENRYEVLRWSPFVNGRLSIDGAYSMHLEEDSNKAYDGSKFTNVHGVLIPGKG